MGEIGHFFNLIFTFPIYNLLMGLYYLFNDFGLAIVVLTIIIKLILYPLTAQQLRSMKAQQDLREPLAELKKKHGSDPQVLQRETMALYKANGVNPLAGCLPLLIQLPVLYGLFFAINNILVEMTKLAEQGKSAADLLAFVNNQLYPFMPHFTTVPDLNLNWFTFLNPNWFISLAIPDPTHVLPIVAGIATFVQLRMSVPATPKEVKNAKKKATPTAPDPSAQTAQMMQFMMPIMTVVFGWTFAAGLALYWTISYLFQVVQQYLLTKTWGALGEMPSFLNFLKRGGTKQDVEVQAKEPALTAKEREATYKPYEGKAAERNNEGAIARELDSIDSARGGGQYNRRQRKNVSRQRRTQQRSHR